MNAIFKALADPTRRKVLELLRQRPMTAGELSDCFPVSRPTMSAHFSVLREADLIEANKIGASIIYHLKLSVLEDAVLSFTQLFGITVLRTPADSAGEAQVRQAREGVDE